MGLPLVVSLLVLWTSVPLAAQQPQRIAGPVAGNSLVVPRTAARSRADVVPAPALARQQPGSWRSALVLGAVAGVIGGIAIASMDGDTKDRTTGDRVKSGVIGGLIIAVPVTVIFAMLIGEDG